MGLSSFLHEESNKIWIIDHLGILPGSIFVIFEVTSTSVAVVIVATPEVVDVKVKSTSVAVVTVATTLCPLEI